LNEIEKVAIGKGMDTSHAYKKLIYAK